MTDPDERKIIDLAEARGDPAAPLMRQMEELRQTILQLEHLLTIALKYQPPPLNEADIARISITAAQGAASCARALVRAQQFRNAIWLILVLTLAFSLGMYLGVNY